MYKIIHNGKVIDVIDKIRYLRYLKKSHKITLSDKSSANCIQASNNKDVYVIQGAKLPENVPYPKVIIQGIDKTEYDKLKKLLDNNISITADNYQLYEARENKIKELNNECNKIIINGISIKLSDNKIHIFELTIEDQLNLSMIQQKLNQGADSCIYHEKNKICKLYTREDLLNIIKHANKHIEYNTTYFNLMKNCIYNMYNIEQINNIHYGDVIPNSEYNSILNLI